MKLLIRNLPRSLTEVQLRALCENCGTVQSCNLVMDDMSGQSKGFAFVNMPRPGEAKAAIRQLNGKELSGMKIRVKKAQDKDAT